VDYLSQLLGRTDEKLQSFVQDVGRFHQGEPLIAIEDVEDDVKLPPTLPERTYNDGKTKASFDERNEATGNNSLKQSNKMPPIPKVPAPKAASMPPTSSDSTAVKSSTSKTAPTRKKAPPVTAPPPKSHPSKGTASVVCGCFGSLHKPLTNCLYCGRISCEREGYDYCAFCGLLVEQVSGEKGSWYVSFEVGYIGANKISSHSYSSKAWEHKERLLRFDRDFARRTVVLDDQADFFTSNRTWLTDEEKAKVEAKEAQQQENLKRGKQKLDIAF
jgi:hypothetical protein